LSRDHVAIKAKNTFCGNNLPRIGKKVMEKGQSNFSFIFSLIVYEIFKKPSDFLQDIFQSAK
jgi:hypothetical protein